MQVDALLGLLDEQVPQDHVCRAIAEIVEQIDTATLEQRFSSLGRRGFHPKHTLAVWVYGSLIGLHEASKLARACRTDAALQWLCGGGKPSAATLKRRRADHAGFFEAAVAQTVALGHTAGLVDVEALAVDSVRIRAHASTKAARTVVRSTKRLAELGQIDPTTLTEEERAKHAAKVVKHQDALAMCKTLGRSNVVLTNPAAGLLKFPTGASAPGHRVTAVASGVKSRFVIGVLVDADGHDYGKLDPAMTKAKAVLDQLGLRGAQQLVVAADAGYASATDLAFAAANRDWLDVLVAVPELTKNDGDHFGRAAFTLHDDGRATCPAGRDMNGPYAHRDGRTLWRGIGCGTCALKPQCVQGKSRALAVDVPAERLRTAMRARLATTLGRKRYNQRIATIEPVFAYIESVMAFRRASSRKPSTVVAEILLKVLAYNIDRLVRAARTATALLCAFFWIDPDGTFGPLASPPLVPIDPVRDDVAHSPRTEPRSALTGADRAGTVALFEDGHGARPVDVAAIHQRAGTEPVLDHGDGAARGHAAAVLDGAGTEVRVQHGLGATRLGSLAGPRGPGTEAFLRDEHAAVGDPRRRRHRRRDDHASVAVPAGTHRTRALRAVPCRALGTRRGRGGSRRRVGHGRRRRGRAARRPDARHHSAVTLADVCRALIDLAHVERRQVRRRARPDASDVRLRAGVLRCRTTRTVSGLAGLAELLHVGRLRVCLLLSLRRLLRFPVAIHLRTGRDRCERDDRHHREGFHATNFARRERRVNRPAVDGSSNARPAGPRAAGTVVDPSSHAAQSCSRVQPPRRRDCLRRDFEAGSSAVVKVRCAGR